VGIVVPDVAAARVQLTEQLGVTWGPIVHLESTEYRHADGRDLVLPTTFSYTVDEPRLEVIEEVPGSIWVRNEHSNLHHIGFWSDDLPAECERLAGVGCPLQLSGRAATQAPVAFAYHRNELGVRVETVDAAMRDAMSFLFEPES
jgi:hypothetical protein